MFSTNTFSQNKIDYSVFKDLYKTDIQIHKKEKIKIKPESEIEYIAYGFYSFYKIIVSSQDENHCYFYPSCSDFALLSIKKQGFILGLISSFDRLSRCRYSEKPKYPVQEKTGLYIDIP
jgi:putative component of membrane protein insertase Oxa1/YidC/SpoIIIJ protein YidD